MALPGVPIDPAALDPRPLVDQARVRLAVGVRQLLAGDHPPVRDLSVPVTGDPGLFGPDSVTWRVHSDAAMLVGGLRALLLQTMHPLAMAGVAEHSRYRQDPLGRLATTSTYVGTVTYGTTDQALDAVAMVKRVHRRVVGTAPDGRPYEANDPHLLTWVHHALVDSFLRAYRRYGAAPLDDADADRYLAEQSVLAEAFGAEPAARSVAELRAWFAAERSELRATGAARDAVRFLAVPPLPLAARAPYGITWAAAVTLLPRWVRRDLWLPVLPGVEPFMVRPAATAMLRSLAWVMAAFPFDRAADAA